MANNYDVKDGAGASKTFKATDNAGVLTVHHNIDTIVPGTSATSLGKAVDSAAGATDTGVAMLGVFHDEDTHTTFTDGDYTRLSVTHFKELRVRDQRTMDLCTCNDHTQVTVLGVDTINLATATNHVFGSAAISFDKANGAENSKYAGVYDTFTAIDMGELFESGAYVGGGAYLPSLTNVVNVFLRIGTDVNNNNCWTWPVANLTGATWLNLRTAAASPDYARNIGTGWDTNAVTYVAFGVEFAAETNALAGIIMDHVHIVGGRVVAADTTANISSSVSTPNVNLLKVGNSTTDTGNGTVGSGTQRVTLASDSTGQVKLAAGTAGIGKLTANSGVDIGDVDIASIAAGTNVIGAVLDAGPNWTSVWGVSGAAVVSADMTTAAAVTNAPAGGQKLILRDIIISTDTAMNVLVEEETSGTDILKVFIPANGTVQVTPRSKIKLATADKKITCKASATGNIAVTCSYSSEA